MAKQTINIGASPNDGTGTPLRTAFDYTNQNFTELYTATGPSGNNIVVPGSATISGALTVNGSGRFQAAGTNWMEFGVNVLTSNQSTGANIRSVVSSAANPTYSWTGDSDTGLFTDTANSIGFAIGGSEGMRLNSTGLGVGVSPAFKGHFYNTGASTELRIENGSTTAGFTNRLSFKSASGAADARTGAIEWYDVGTFKGDIRLLKAGGIQMRNSADVPTFNLDDTGNVGIGVTPSAWTTSNNVKALQFGGGSVYTYANDRFFIGQNVCITAASGDTYINTATASAYRQYQGIHSWYTAPSGTAGNAITFTQAMTLDASGNLLLACTSAPTGSTSGFYFDATRYAYFSRSAGETLNLNRYTSTGATAKFRYAGTEVGDISVTGAGTTYNSTSDYRLKESVAPLSGGLARVNALKPSIYKWKSDGSSGEGFLAHELAEVVPAAVTGEKDAVNEDGSIKSQSIDMSRVVPILVAAIKELTARVQTLEAK